MADVPITIRYETGFCTPTVKIELYSTVTEELGYDPLRYYRGPRESSTRTPELAKEYPLVLITDGRFHPFFHSEHRVAESPRRGYPRATMQIRPDTAKERDLIDGDWAWIETLHGRVMQEVKTIKNLDPLVLHVQRRGDMW